MSQSQQFEVGNHPQHPRLRRLMVAPDALRDFFRRCHDESVQHLEYVPFARLMVARHLREVLGPEFVESLKQIVNDRDCGGFTLGIGEVTQEIDEFIIFSTAITHLIGIPNFDAMCGTYYARFTVTHMDDSDSYLRKAYLNMTLHTDGTYVEDTTDWLLMMKLAEHNASGGRSRLLHLDDWEDLDHFSEHPLASHAFSYRSPPSKNVETVVNKPTFYQVNDRPCLCFIDQFVYPETIEEAGYLHDLSASMENSPATLAVDLPVGELVLLNNGFWVHGREAFKPHPDLFRELLRQRGYFAET